MPVVPELAPLLSSLGANPVDFTAITAPELRQLFKALTFPVPQHEGVAEITDSTVPGPAGPIPVRVYRPQGEGPHPVLVWYHGGGWVIGDLDSGDVTCQLASGVAGALVVSVDYRLAPEHPFPAGPDDAWAALVHVAAHAEEMGGDPARIAVGGDSAGANLAALVAIRARDEGGPALVHQMLVYPATDLVMEHPSIDANGEGFLLSKASMLWFRDQYLGVDREHGDPASPAVSPLRVADLSGLPPAQVMLAELDPLHDEGEEYGARLAAAGVPTVVEQGEGLIHGYAALSAFSPSCAAAVDASIERLRAALHPS